jgi:DNA-binding transcriptional MerR regulator
MDDFVTPSQAAQILHVDDSTLRKWYAQGRLTSIRVEQTAGGQRRYHRGDIERASRDQSLLKTTDQRLEGMTAMTLIPDEEGLISSHVSQNTENVIVSTKWVEATGEYRGVFSLDLLFRKGDLSRNIAAADQLYALLGGVRVAKSGKAIVEELNDLLSASNFAIEAYVRDGARSAQVQLWGEHARRVARPENVAPDRADGRPARLGPEPDDDVFSFDFPDQYAYQRGRQKAAAELNGVDACASERVPAEPDHPPVEQLAVMPGTVEYCDWVEQSMDAYERASKLHKQLRSDGWEVHDLGIDDHCNMFCYRKAFSTLATAQQGARASGIDTNGSYLVDDSDWQLDYGVSGTDKVDSVEPRSSMMDSAGQWA